MARSYGEGFYSPVGIPGAPLQGFPTANPYNRGRVILEPLPNEQPVPGRLAANPVISQPKLVYDYDGDGM